MWSIYRYRLSGECRLPDGYYSSVYPPALKSGVTSNIALQASCCFRFDESYFSNIVLQASYVSELRKQAAAVEQMGGAGDETAMRVVA